MATTKKTGMQYQRSISTKVNVLGRSAQGGKDTFGRSTAVRTKKRAD